MKQSIFLTHKNTLGFDNKITGGVQLCSQEYYKIIEKSGYNIVPYYVNYTKNIFHRVCIKFGWDSYLYYNIKKDINGLIKYIEEHKIEYVFINHSSLIRYARSIKSKFNTSVNIILLSHGNDSGDFVHVAAKRYDKSNVYKKVRDKYRLGSQLLEEALHKQNYIDTVFTVSLIEESIEKWTGAMEVKFIPRSINKDVNFELRSDYNKSGFIGRLDHPPNFHGLTYLCDEILKIYSNKNPIEIIIIGAPEKYGRKFERKYPFLKYKGELNDADLFSEISTWSVFLNPVYWVSMGVTTKVAKAIEWGVPILTTSFGLRGYSWKQGKMLMADTPNQMALTLVEVLGNKVKIQHAKNEMKKIKDSSFSLDELAEIIKI